MDSFLNAETVDALVHYPETVDTTTTTEGNMTTTIQNTIEDRGQTNTTTNVPRGLAERPVLCIDRPTEGGGLRQEVAERGEEVAAEAMTGNINPAGETDPHH